MKDSRPCKARHGMEGCYDKQQGAPASMRLPKNFQPVGTSKKGRLCAAATRSNAPLVGIERATPCGPLAK